MTKSARTSIKGTAPKPQLKPAPNSPSGSALQSVNTATDSFVPYPLFPPFVLLGEHEGLLRPINEDVCMRLDTLDPALGGYSTWRLGIDFLVKQCQHPEFTARHYKILCPILETMMHWSWSIRCKPFPEWQETDAREFMRFVMRPPMSWMSQTGGPRYMLKTMTEFAVKPINDKWRPIVRMGLSDQSAPVSDFVLGTSQRRQIFIHRGKVLFDYIGAVRRAEAASPDQNPFRNLQPRQFEVRQVKKRTIFTPAQLADLMSTATLLAEQDKQWQPLLLVAALAIYSDAPFRALGSTSVLKLTFSNFKTTDMDPPQNLEKQAFPAWFESPHYPRLLFPLNRQFPAYFRRYAQFRHSQNPDTSSQSVLLPLMDGTDGYAGHTLVGLFANFTTKILTTLQQSPLASRACWKGPKYFQAGAVITFLELRKSAKVATWVPDAMKIAEPQQNDDAWPTIGIRVHLPASQWLRKYAATC